MVSVPSTVHSWDCEQIVFQLLKFYTIYTFFCDIAADVLPNYSCDVQPKHAFKA